MLMDVLPSGKSAVSLFYVPLNYSTSCFHCMYSSVTPKTVQKRGS